MRLSPVVNPSLTLPVARRERACLLARNPPTPRAVPLVTLVAFCLLAPACVPTDWAQSPRLVKIAIVLPLSSVERGEAEKASNSLVGSSLNVNRRLAAIGSR